MQYYLRTERTMHFSKHYSLLIFSSFRFLLFVFTMDAFVSALKWMKHSVSLYMTQSQSVVGHYHHYEIIKVYDYNARIQFFHFLPFLFQRYKQEKGKWRLFTWQTVEANKEDYWHENEKRNFLFQNIFRAQYIFILGSFIDAKIYFRMSYYPF